MYLRISNYGNVKTIVANSMIATPLIDLKTVFKNISLFHFTSSLPNHDNELLSPMPEMCSKVGENTKV